MTDTTQTHDSEAPAVAGQVERPVRPWEKCSKHGPARPRVWACPTCLVELRRWKGAHAPRMEALEGLLRTAQLEAAAGREAVATLASERAANSRLTEELEEAQKQRNLLHAALLEALRVAAKVDPKGAARWLREYGFVA